MIPISDAAAAAAMTRQRDTKTPSLTNGVISRKWLRTEMVIIERWSGRGSNDAVCGIYKKIIMRLTLGGLAREDFRVKTLKGQTQPRNRYIHRTAQVMNTKDPSFPSEFFTH